MRSVEGDQQNAHPDNSRAERQVSRSTECSESNAQSAITLVESSVIALAQATERNPPPVILPVKSYPHRRGDLGLRTIESYR